MIPLCIFLFFVVGSCVTITVAASCLSSISYSCLLFIFASSNCVNRIRKNVFSNFSGVQKRFKSFYVIYGNVKNVNLTQFLTFPVARSGMRNFVSKFVKASVDLPLSLSLSGVCLFSPVSGGLKLVKIGLILVAFVCSGNGGAMTRER